MYDAHRRWNGRQRFYAADEGMAVATAVDQALSHAAVWDLPPLGNLVMSGSADSVEAARERLENTIAEQHRRVDAWIQEGNHLRAKLWNVCAPENCSVEHLAQLDNLIHAVAVKQAQETNNLESARQRMNEQVSSVVLPTAQDRSDLNQVLGRMFEPVERANEERTDFLMFLRALRARHDPEAQRGRVFDDADALRDYLDTLTG